MRRAQVLDRIRQGFALVCTVPGGDYYLRRSGGEQLFVPTPVVVGLVRDKLVASDKREPIRSYNLTELGRALLGIPPLVKKEEKVTNGTASEPSGDTE